MRPSSLASRANRNGCAPSSRRCNATVSDAARSSSIPINWDWRWRTSSKLSPRPRLEKSKRRYPPQSRPVRRRQVNRGALPTHLPRIEVVIDVDDRHCPCCAGALHKIGEDVAERLDVIPLQFRVLVIRRPKYACRTCPGTVLQAPASPRLIEGGLPTEALVAHVIVAKYADHSPLYRQAQIYARQGIALDRSTLANWSGRAAW